MDGSWPSLQLLVHCRLIVKAALLAQTPHIDVTSTKILYFKSMVVLNIEYRMQHHLVKVCQCVHLPLFPMDFGAV